MNHPRHRGPDALHPGQGASAEIGVHAGALPGLRCAGLLDRQPVFVISRGAVMKFQTVGEAGNRSSSCCRGRSAPSLPLPICTKNCRAIVASCCRNITATMQAAPLPLLCQRRKSLPCIKDDFPQCGEMPQSDRGARRVSGWHGATVREGLQTYGVDRFTTQTGRSLSQPR